MFKNYVIEITVSRNSEILFINKILIDFEIFFLVKKLQYNLIHLGVMDSCI